MSKYLSERFHTLKPYVPGEQPQNRRYIKLNTNENPYPPAPGVLDAINREAVGDLRLYPDPTSTPLLDAIARRYGLSDNQVFVGNSSDEVLAFAFMAFCDAEKPVAFPTISYGFYPVFARLFGLDDAVQIPLCADLTIDAEAYIGIGRNVVLANPNAPTGIMLPIPDIERIVLSNPGHLVLIDEAYVDFAEDSALRLINRYDNLLLVRTFSKSRALAGARLGYALGQAHLIDDLNRVKNSFHPYNINRLTMIAGIEAMRDQTYFEDCRERIIMTREATKCALRGIGFSVTDSSTNFLFAKPPRISGKTYYDKLRDMGVLVRHWDAPAEIADYVRVTVGADEDMLAFLDATRQILEEG